MTNLNSDFEAKLNLVKSNYNKSLKEKYSILLNLNERIFQVEDLGCEDSVNAIKELYEHSHKLAGSSAIFGFAELSKISNKLELLLKESIDTGYVLDKNNVFESFDTLLKEMEKIIKEVQI